MTTASQKTLQVLEQIVKVVPVGTNLALLQTEKSAPFGHRFPIFGHDPERTRTSNQLIKSQLLCQLSYRALLIAS
jgi:hypothetical protein